MLYLPLQSTVCESTYEEAMASRAKAQMSHVIMSNASSAQFGKDNLDEYTCSIVLPKVPPPLHYLSITPT